MVETADGEFLARHSTSAAHIVELDAGQHRPSSRSSPACPVPLRLGARAGTCASSRKPSCSSQLLYNEIALGIGRRTTGVIAPLMAVAGSDSSTHMEASTRNGSDDVKTFSRAQPCKKLLPQILAGGWM